MRNFNGDQLLILLWAALAASLIFILVNVFVGICFGEKADLKLLSWVFISVTLLPICSSRIVSLTK